MDIDTDKLRAHIKTCKELCIKPEYNNDGMKQTIYNHEQILEACMSDNFKTTTGEYKGNKTISIKKEYENKDGETKDGHVLTFGVNKAKAILSVVDDIKKFVEDNDKNTIDVSKLTPEQLDLVNSFVQK